MFKRIAIDNYRCFTNFEFAPERINLLLGSNGSGKSSLFDLMAAVVDLVVGAAEIGEVFPSSTLTRWDRRDRQRVELEVEGDGGLYRYNLVVAHDVEHERAVIESERVIRDGKTLFSFEGGTVRLHRNDGTAGASFAFRGNRSFLAQIEERPETKDLRWFLEYLAKVWTLRLNAREMASFSLEENETLARNGSNFASWYRHISQESPERIHTLWAALKPVVPGFQALKLISTGGKGRARDLVTSMSTSGTPYDVDFDELSDGQRALVVLYALLTGFDHEEGCLMLDEPEAHVGLSEIQPWLVELDDRFIDRGQVFVASHHPNVIDYMSAGTAYVFERPDGGPARVRAAPFEHDGGISPSEQVTRSLLDAR